MEAVVQWLEGLGLGHYAPARRMIDLLSRMGWEPHKGPEDPLFKAMQRSVDRVGRDYDRELSVFAQAVTDLEASIQAEERAAAATIAEPIAAALKQEKMTESAKLAKNSMCTGATNVTTPISGWAILAKAAISPA